MFCLRYNLYEYDCHSINDSERKQRQQKRKRERERGDAEK